MIPSDIFRRYIKLRKIKYGSGYLGKRPSSERVPKSLYDQFSRTIGQDQLKLNFYEGTGRKILSITWRKFTRNVFVKINRF